MGLLLRGKRRRGGGRKGEKEEGKG